ncbi:MAG: hypothetical protein ACO2PP_24445 [Thermocrinis sp.]|uniref:hypothetical protein n=1 Tax=Thermocrinis sp. TaxID=2024383 RepID=UPI003C0CAF0F
MLSHTVGLERTFLETYRPVVGGSPSHTVGLELRNAIYGLMRAKVRSPSHPVGSE